MQTKIFLGILGLVSMFIWSELRPSQEIQAQPPDEPARAEKKTVIISSESSRADEARQPTQTQLQVQLATLDLQERQLGELAREQIRQLEEQVRDQIEQWKSDLTRQIGQLQRQSKRQIDQTQSYVKWQVEQIEAQKKLLEAQALSTKTIGQTMPAFGMGPPLAAQKAVSGPGSVQDKLDKILDRLERLEKRIERLEKR